MTALFVCAFVIEIQGSALAPAASSGHGSTAQTAVHLTGQEIFHIIGALSCWVPCVLGDDGLHLIKYLLINERGACARHGRSAKGEFSDVCSVGQRAGHIGQPEWYAIAAHNAPALQILHHTDGFLSGGHSAEYLPQNGRFLLIDHDTAVHLAEAIGDGAGIDTL